MTYRLKYRPISRFWFTSLNWSSFHLNTYRPLKIWYRHGGHDQYRHERIIEFAKNHFNQHVRIMFSKLRLTHNFTTDRYSKAKTHLKQYVTNSIRSTKSSTNNTAQADRERETVFSIFTLLLWAYSGKSILWIYLHANTSASWTIFHDIRPEKLYPSLLRHQQYQTKPGWREGIQMALTPVQAPSIDQAAGYKNGITNSQMQSWRA